ncbi:FHA domain-containing protein [Kribbella rubisoli]|uniref:FHA domain-containing protein n=1 Tax=Kribbella rubisoli TaxID=3075929 RepID=A0A4V2FY23_9ACTN|nr:FHA domain-containing protein [Kribbella rubisoli]
MLSLGEQRWTLPAGTDTFTIGRASNADIRLQADDQISRIHARLSRDGTTWTLHDESRNGTGLNGHRITAPTALSTGDRIHIGRSILTFHKSTSPDRVMPATTQPDGVESNEAGSGEAGSGEARAAGHRSPAAPGPGAAAGAAPGSAVAAGAASGASAGASSGTAAPEYAPAEPRYEPTPVSGYTPEPNPAYAPEPDPGYTPEPTPGASPAARGHEPASDPGYAPEPTPGGSPDARGYEPADSGYTRERRSGGSADGPGYAGFAAQEAPSVAPPGPAGPASGGAFPPAEEPWGADAVGGGEEYGGLAYQGDAAAEYQAAEYQADEAVGGGEEYGEPAYRGEEEYGAAGVVPGFEVEEPVGRAGDGGWAAYPSADNPEPVRSPWEISARVEQAEPNWSQSDNWPEPSRAPAERRLPGADRRTNADRRANADRRTNAERGASTDRRTDAELGTNADRHTNAERSSSAERRAAGGEGDAVGTVRLPRLLIVSAGIIVLGLIVNLIVTFLADGPGGALRWLVPPGIALVVAMVLALLDAAAPKDHRPGRLDVSILIAIAVVLVGVGVGGFVLTAGTEYVGGYLTGNESGEDRLVKPIAKPSGAVTVTVENVTYTSHFTRVEVMLANGAKEPVTIPIAGATFTAADGTALRADTRRSSWPSKVATGGTQHGTITFKGKLPDSADAAVLTLKSGETAFAVPVALSN